MILRGCRLGLGAHRTADLWPTISFLLVLWFFLAFIIGSYFVYNDSEIPLISNLIQPKQHHAVHDMVKWIREQRKNTHSLHNDTYVANPERTYTIKPNSHKWHRLGKQILIVDIDTRLDEKPGALMGSRILNKEIIQPRAAGYLNHYLYSLIHGYDYKIIRAPEYHDRHNTWVKVPVIRQAVKEHKFVVFLDADATFQRFDVPLEWLLSMWNITPENLLAMPEDPNSPVNRDSKGWVLWNTGFVIAQQSERTDAVLREWEDCPLGKKHEGCKKWAYDWAHEQAAFGNFVRYGWNKTDDLRVLPCMDANGASYIKDKMCQGIFISHHWGEKKAPIKDLYARLDDHLVEGLQRHFWNHKEEHFVDWSEHSYPLGNATL